MLTTSKINEFIEGLNKENQQELLFKLICDAVVAYDADSIEELKESLENEGAIAQLEEAEREANRYALGSED